MSNGRVTWEGQGGLVRSLVLCRSEASTVPQMLVCVHFRAGSASSSCCLTYSGHLLQPKITIFLQLCSFKCSGTLLSILLLWLLLLLMIRRQPIEAVLHIS